MKRPLHTFVRAFKCAALFAAGAACLSSVYANPALTNGLVSYWPLDTTNNGSSTPDLQSGFSLIPRAGSSTVTFAAASMSLSSGGVHSNCIILGNNGLLGYQSPENAQGTPSTALPPTQFPNYTVSLWVKGSLANMPAAGGDRIFAAGYSQSTSPVLDFNTGGSGGASGETTSVLDNFVRQYGGTETANGVGTIFANYSGGSHRQINANPWDGNWHNLTLVAQMITNNPPPVVQPIAAPLGGSITFTFSSIPLDNSNGAYLTAFGNNTTEVSSNQQYLLQQSADLLNWTTVATQASAGYAGTTITFNSATNTNAFYRVIQPGVRLQNWSFYMDDVFISSSLQFTNNISIDVPVGVPSPNGNTSYLQNTGNEPGGSDPAAIQPPLGIWQCDQFAVGGLFRTSAGSYLPAGTAVDDVGVWKRALSPAEIANYMADGVTNTVASIPLTVTLTSDFPAVATNDIENLHWVGAANATYSIQPNIGDVSPDTTDGIGSVSAVITSNITYTITATRLGLTATSSVSVIAVSNVNAGWHYIDSFTYLPDGLLNGQGAWLNPPAGVYSPLVPMEIRASSVDGNNYISFDGEYNNGTPEEGGLAGRKLNGDSIPVGSSNTLFFRFYLDPNLTNADANLGGNFPDVDCNVGLSDKPLRDPIDFDGTGANNTGPAIWIERNAGGNGGPIDLQAADGSAAMTLTPAGYSYIADTNNGNANGLSVGYVYNVWIDIQNNPSEVAGGLDSGGAQTNGDYYTVWLQRSDWPNRTNLFQYITPTNSTLGVGYPTGVLVSDRDDSTVDSVETPSELLDNLFLCTSKSISLEDTNMLRFDDFYLSTSGYLSTLPVAAGSMAP